jgi:hypothetical protein
MFFFGVVGAMCFMMIACATVDVGSFWIDDVPVTGREFLARTSIPLTIVGLVALATAYALSRDWWWGRFLILSWIAIPMLVAVGLAVYTGDITAIAQTVGGSAVILGPLAAILFLKTSVVAYYDARRPRGFGKPAASLDR